MQNVQRQLLACLKAYRLGQAQAEDTALDAGDWPALYQLAAQQKLSAVVYETLYRSADFCGSDAALAARWKRETILQVSGQAIRTQKLLRLTGELDAAGVSYAVVKGALCRQLYEKADLRPSGDEDILIPGRGLPRGRDAQSAAHRRRTAAAAGFQGNLYSMPPNGVSGVHQLQRDSD